MDSFPANLYPTEDAPQYNGNQAGYRAPSNNNNNINYAYESQTWNYGGANGASTMGAAGRMRPQQQARRAEIPTVSCSSTFFHGNLLRTIQSC